MKKFIRYFFHRDHVIITLFAFVLLALFNFIVINVDFLNPISRALDNFSITDMFFEVRHSDEPEACDLITIVDMTDLYERGDIAELIREVDECNPLCIGVDLIFEGVRDDYVGNEMLEQTISDLKSPAVFANKLTEYNSVSNSFQGIVRTYCADNCSITDAYTNVTDDMMGSCIREFSLSRLYKDDSVASFPAMIAGIIDNTTVNYSEEDQLINYGDVDFRVIPYDSIFENRDLIEGSIVIIGTMNEERDMHNTPLGKMAGAKIQAYSLLTLLEHRQVHQIPDIICWIIAYLLCYLLEISIDIFYQISKAHPNSVFQTFIREANIISIVFLFVFEVLACWAFYILFIKENLLMGGGVILATIVLTCEARDIYMAIIKGFYSKYDNKSFFSKSLMIDDNP